MPEATPNIAIGKMLIMGGLILLLVGILFLTADKLPFLKNFGRLPGDIAVEKENFRFYFPVATSILLSVGLTLAFWFFNRFMR